MRQLLAALVCSAAVSCAPTTGAPTAPAVPPTELAIMGGARLSAQQLVGWFDARTPRPPGSYAATVPLEILATYYIEEGAAEGVTGDVAFIQSVVETGWFRFQGTVPPSANNFAGLGAVDSSSGIYAVFSDARTGVRAQIQHLRAYADSIAQTCTVPPLVNPCVDPRFALVTPKGKAPMWHQLGNGNWATASTYAGSILSLYHEALQWNRGTN